MSDIPFLNSVPIRYLWVNGGAASGGDGSKDAPLNNIQTAIAKAKPGTAIMVEAGEYHTNVIVQRTADGTKDAPIWLVSADGPGKAHIIAEQKSLPAIGGGGVQNFIVDGFMTTGGKNGIHFGQNGFDYTDMVANIVIRNNIIVNPIEDGVKANGGSGFYVINNTITGGNDEGIDFVAIAGGVISGNEVSGNTGTSAGIFAKFGSSDIVIANNYVHDNAAVGISVGGYVNAEVNMMPGTETYQAKNIVVRDNIIVDNGRVPIAVFGSKSVEITNNLMNANAGYFTASFVGSSNPTKYGTFTSSDVNIAHNVITQHRTPLTVGDGSNAVFNDNGPNVTLDTAKMGFYTVYLKATSGDIASASTIEPLVSPAVSSGVEPIERFNLISLENLFTHGWHESAAAQQTVKNGLGSALNETMTGKADQFVGGGGDDTYMLSRTNADRISEAAGGGVDTLIVNGKFGALVENVENLALSSAMGATLFGNTTDNRITGNAGNDLIDGKGGRDYLAGNGGADRFLIGGDARLTRITDFSADDRIHITGLASTSFEDLKSGMVQYKDATFVVLADDRTIILENVKIADLSAAQFTLSNSQDSARLGEVGSKSVSVNKNSMTATGSDASETIVGNGNSVLIGGAGDDRYLLLKDGDRIIEDSSGGTDTAIVKFAKYQLEAGVENLISRFDAGASLTGNGLANIIKGSAGNDWIVGSGGADVLSGGAGADTFVFATLGDAGDVITDFQVGSDRLDFSDLRAANPGIVVHIEESGSGVAVYANVGSIETLVVSLDNVSSSLMLNAFEFV